jgi:hypothetical protein
MVYFVNASAETYIVNSIKFPSSFDDVVKGNLHKWASNFGEVMDLEIKFNNWMRSNSEPLEIIK